jgi:hypothetical protein
VTAPQRPHAFACTWYSVTRGGGGGLTSNSCSFCTPLTAASARLSPQPPHRGGAHTTASSGGVGRPQRGHLRTQLLQRGFRRVIGHKSP